MGACTAMRMRMQPGMWRCGNRDHRRQVRASEITLSGGVRCSGRGRARGGTHSNANAHAHPDYRTSFMQCTCDNYLMYHLFVKRSTCDR